jgi:hypothetical protein
MAVRGPNSRDPTTAACGWTVENGALRHPHLDINIPYTEFEEATADGLPAVVVRYLEHSRVKRHPHVFLDEFATAYGIFRHRLNTFSHRPDWRNVLQRRLIEQRPKKVKTRRRSADGWPWRSR